MKIYWMIITSLYMAFLAYVSLNPAMGSSHYSASLQKQLVHNICHIPAYGALAWLVFQCLKGRECSYLILASAIAFAYGLFMEICQSFVPYRFFSFGDVLLNALGIWFLWILLRKNFPQGADS